MRRELSQTLPEAKNLFSFRHARVGGHPDLDSRFRGNDMKREVLR